MDKKQSFVTQEDLVMCCDFCGERFQTHELLPVEDGLSVPDMVCKNCMADMERLVENDDDRVPQRNPAPCQYITSQYARRGKSKWAPNSR